MNSQLASDRTYCGLPWKAGGRSKAGLDCAGLAYLWLKENVGFEPQAPASSIDNATLIQHLRPFVESELERGDVVFFHVERFAAIHHVAIYIGQNRFLHIIAGCTSRIENGLTLLRRIGCKPVGVVSPREAETLSKALNADLGDPGTVGSIIFSLVLIGISYGISATTQQSFKAKIGKYGPNALLTRSDPQIPLPDVLGKVVVAGNAVYQQLADKNDVSNAVGQKWNQVVVLASGPSEQIDFQTGLQIKGISWQDKSWHNGNYDGIFINPAQTKAEAVTGSIAGDSNVPSISLYAGAYDISVPVDIRAQYDRTFPIYGMAGCTYLVGRWIDGTKFSNFNITTRIKCRLCRTFDTDGFIVTAIAGESLAGADGSKVRFKLAFEDIESVSTVTVNGTPYTQISASNQAGNIFHLNATKGYVEFITAPAAAATVLVDYNYYPREWTQNPAMHAVYLLTEPRRGKGFSGNRISWTDAVAFRDYCDDTVSWTNSTGTISGPRFQTNYAVDDRKPIQDHIKPVLDAANAMLFLSNGKFVLLARQDGSSVFSFDPSNILVGAQGGSTFSRELTDRTSKPNRVKVLYSSEDNLNSENEAPADDEANQDARAERVGNDGVIEEELQLPAVTDQAQAERLARMYVSESVGSKWVYRWTTNIKGLALQPGDIVDMTHPRIPGVTILLRLETIEQDAMDLIAFSASEYVPQVYA